MKERKKSSIDPYCGKGSRDPRRNFDFHVPEFDHRPRDQNKIGAVIGHSSAQFLRDRCLDPRPDRIAVDGGIGLRLLGQARNSEKAEEEAGGRQ